MICCHVTQHTGYHGTEEVEAADGDHQVEVGTVEAATRGPGQPQHHGEAEEAVEAGAEAAAEAGVGGEQGDHRSVSRYCVPRNEPLIL